LHERDWSLSTPAEVHDPLKIPSDGSIVPGDRAQTPNPHHERVDALRGLGDNNLPVEREIRQRRFGTPRVGDDRVVLGGITGAHRERRRNPSFASDPGGDIATRKRRHRASIDSPRG
jgi:hypothetical protein